MLFKRNHWIAKDQWPANFANGLCFWTSGSAMAEGPRDALVSRNSATTKYPYRMALIA